MDKLDKINIEISKINEKIDNLLDEQFEYKHPIERLINYVVDTGLEKAPEIVTYVNKKGEEIDSIPDSLEDVKDFIKDKQKEKDKSKELSDFDKKVKREIELAKKQLKKSRSIGTVVPANVGDDEKDPIFDKSGRMPYNYIKVNFRGVNELSVQIGGNQEIKQKLTGVVPFDIITIKETSLGYIMRLHNDNFNKDVDLLLYAQFLKDKPQTNKIQLVYKKGKFVGSPKNVTFEILRIS